MFGAIAVYVLNAIAVMLMANKLGIANGWLAFIPVGDMYMRGRIADTGSGKSANTTRLMVMTIVQGCIAAAYIISIIGVANRVYDFAILMAFAWFGLLISSLIQFIFLRVADHCICDNFGSGVFVFLLLTSLFGLAVVAAILRLVMSSNRPTVYARRFATSTYDQNAFSSSSPFSSSSTSSFSSDSHSDFSQPFGSSWNDDRFR